MERGALTLLGLHDFATFCKPREGATTIRTLQQFRWEREPDGVLVARLQADAFCHSMVRAMVGATIAVGEGRFGPDRLEELRVAEERTSAFKTAPAKGLTLTEVGYPADAELAERAEQTRADGRWTVPSRDEPLREPRSVVSVAPGVVFVEGPVSNWVVLAEEDGVALIDAGYPADTDLVLDTVRAAGHDPADLRRVYVTHGHVDHVGGIPGILERYPDVEVLARADELANVRGPQTAAGHAGGDRRPTCQPALARLAGTGDPLRRPPTHHRAVRSRVHRCGLRGSGDLAVPGRRPHRRLDRVPAARGGRGASSPATRSSADTTPSRGRGPRARG